MGQDNGKFQRPIQIKDFNFLLTGTSALLHFEDHSILLTAYTGEWHIWPAFRRIAKIARRAIPDILSLFSSLCDGSRQSLKSWRKEPSDE